MLILLLEKNSYSWCKQKTRMEFPRSHKICTRKLVGFCGLGYCALFE